MRTTHFQVFPTEKMTAVILAGGISVKTHDRYDSLRTCGVPKHVIPICDKPLLCYPIETLVTLGYPRIVIVAWASQLDEIREAVSPFKPARVELIWVAADEVASSVQALVLALAHIPSNDSFIVIPGDIMASSVLSQYTLSTDADAAVTLYPDADEHNFIIGLNSSGSLAYLKTVEDVEFDGQASLPPQKMTLRGDLQDAKIFHFRNTPILAGNLKAASDDEESLLLAVSNLPAVSVILLPPVEKKFRCRSLPDFLAWTQSVARAQKLKNGAFTASAVPDDVVVKNACIAAGVSIGTGARVARSIIMTGASVAPGITVEDALVCASVTENCSGGVIPRPIRTWKFQCLLFPAFTRMIYSFGSLLIPIAMTVKVAPYPPYYMPYYAPQPPPQNYYYPAQPSYAPQYMYPQPQPQPQVFYRPLPQSLVGMTPPTLMPDPDAESSRLLQGDEYIVTTTTTTTPPVRDGKLFSLLGKNHHQPFHVMEPAPVEHVASPFEQSLQDAMNRAVSVLDVVPTFAPVSAAEVEVPMKATIPSWQELLGKERQSGIFA